MNKRKSDHLRYYWGMFTKNLMTFFCKVLTALSFLMIVFYFGYIVYYSTVGYSNFLRVIAGCISLFNMTEAGIIYGMLARQISSAFVGSLAIEVVFNFLGIY